MKNNVKGETNSSIYFTVIQIFPYKSDPFVFSLLASNTLVPAENQILQGIRYTLQGLRKDKVCKKSFVWLPWQLFDNMVLFAIIVKTSMKNRYFSNASRNHKLEVVNIKLCVVIVLFLYFSKK